MVFPAFRNSSIFAALFRPKCSSPTLRISSMRRISGSTCVATANASRAYIPLEYVRTGSSMKSASSENSMISSSRVRISRRDIPRMIPLTKMFSRPEKSGWNPAPSSSSAEIRPCTSTVPRVGV